MTDTTKPTGDTIAYAPNMDVSRMLNALRSYAHSGAKSAYQHDEIDAYVSNLSKIDAELRSRLAERPNRAVARGDSERRKAAEIITRFIYGDGWNLLAEGSRDQRIAATNASLHKIEQAGFGIFPLTTPTETTDPAMENEQ